MLSITRYDSPQVPQAHDHAGYELIYIDQGRAAVEAGGRTYEAQAPACVFLSNLEKHRLRPLSEPYVRYALIIPPEEALSALRSPLLLSPFRNRPRDFSHVLACPPLAAHFEQMLEEAGHDDIFTEACLQHRLYLLMTKLYRCAPEAFPLSRHQYPESLLAVQQYLDEHFQEDISIQELSRRFFISAGYLQHRFTELAGCSPKQYLILNRLYAAQQLLLTTQMRVTEVALACGFPDSANFIRRFSARYGETPARYRKSRGQ